MNQALVDHPDRAATDLSSVRLINVQGTTRLREALRDAHPNATLLHAYGSTELGGIVSLTDPAMPNDELAHDLRHSLARHAGPDPRPRHRDRGRRSAPAARSSRGAGACSRATSPAPGRRRRPWTSTAGSIRATGAASTSSAGSVPRPAQGHAQDRRRERRRVELESFLAAAPCRRHRPGRGRARRPPRRGRRRLRRARARRRGAGVRAHRVLPRRIASYKIPRYVRFVDEWPMSGHEDPEGRLREQLLAELEAAGPRRASRRRRRRARRRSRSRRGRSRGRAQRARPRPGAHDGRAGCRRRCAAGCSSRPASPCHPAGRR